MNITEQCDGCGEDVTTKRGPVRTMCTTCLRVRRNKLPRPQQPEGKPTFDALGFCTGYQLESK